MKKKFIIAVVVVLFISCDKSLKTNSIVIDDVYAWCIVPFDSEKRLPEQRIDMLKRLGIKKYGYDWRINDLPNMASELKLAKQNAIEVISVWLWIDDNWDNLQKLNQSNEEVLSTVEEVGYKGEIWVSFNANFFENLSDEAAVEKGSKMIQLLNKKASKLGCKLALYNHGDWFGNPINQIKIIKTLPKKNIGLVYNFHHAHNQIDQFYKFVPVIMPYLWHVNLNGLKEEGPKILTIGQGNHEKQMIDFLINQGYKNDFGILGHIEDEDVELVLKSNLDGLKKMYNSN